MTDNIRWPPGIKPPTPTYLRSSARKRALEQPQCLNGCGRPATTFNSFCSTTCAESYRARKKGKTDDRSDI